MSDQRAELLRKNRESHYDIDQRKPSQSSQHTKSSTLREPVVQRQPPMIDNRRPPPRPQERQIPYDPLARSREQVVPPPPPPKTIPYPRQPQQLQYQRPIDPELKLISDLKKFRKTVPENEVSQQVAPPKPIHLAQRHPPLEKPKGKRINPKDDPNCMYCFRCSEWHHKDLHQQQSVPQFVPQKRPQHEATIASHPSKPSREELMQHQRTLSRAINPDPVYLPKKNRLRRYEDSEEDEFDYDDGFIVNDLDEEQNWGRELRKVTGYNPDAYDDDDFDDRDMEVRDFAELEREDLRSRYYGIPHLTRPKR